MSSINLTEIQDKLVEKLEPSGWKPVLEEFAGSAAFFEILCELADQMHMGDRFTPPIKYLFRAFEECPVSDLKVVIIGQDPYPQEGVADGISFSCSLTQKVQPSLRYIFKEIERTVYMDGYTWDPDLKRWSNQGVLMLNTSLTTKLGEIGKHFELWEPFTEFLLRKLSEKYPGLVYVFLGNKAKEWSKLIGPNNFKFFAPHPASAAYAKENVWNSGDLFNKINSILEKHYKTNIKW